VLDVIDKVNNLRQFKRSFILSPEKWRGFTMDNLEWNQTKFQTNNSEQIPQSKGIYCFVIKHDNPCFPSHGYITYIGKTGDGNERTLRDRYKDYIREKRRPKRVHIYELLNQWEEDLYFQYWEAGDDIDLGEVETNLLDCIIPPLNRKDFTGDFGKIVREAFAQ